MSTTTSSSRRNRKIAAIAAGALVVGLGATYTLASWNDSEWVWGGANGGPGIGTDTFDVEQLTEGTWHDDETNPGGALDFTAAALSLSPGETVYAPMSLRTKVGSIGGDVTLQGAVSAVGITPLPTDVPGVAPATSGLWNAVTLSVFTSAATTAPTCNAASVVVPATWTPVAGIAASPLSTGATAQTGAQALPAATASVAGAPQHYCFVVALPTNAETAFQTANPTLTLQGRSVAPAWEFAAVSN